MGQLPPGAITLVETVEDARTFEPRDPDNLAWITQTTLSIDDTAEIVAVLKERFPTIAGPHKEDICYATTNRQEAVKQVAPFVDRMIVVGAPNSSNSQRLRRSGGARRLPEGGADPARLGDRLERVRGRREDRRDGRRVGAGGDRRGGARRLRRSASTSMSSWSALPKRTSSSAFRGSSATPRPRAGATQWRSTPMSAMPTSKRFLSAYDLGALLSFKGIAEGVENSNFLLRTETRQLHPDALREARRGRRTCRSSSG